MTNEERTESYGYMRYRCPKCKRTFYDDAGPECPNCGPEEKEQEDAPTVERSVTLASEGILQMIDRPLTFDVAPGRVHCCFINQIDIEGKPDDHYVHPCFAFANEDGYNRNEKIAWQKKDAERFAAQYNTEVLKLTPGQAEAILISSMRFPKCHYPSHYEKNKESFESIGQKLVDHKTK